MNFDEYNYEQIEQYLAQELKGEALEKFEAALQSDRALAVEVQLVKEMNELLVESPENELRKNLQQLSDQVSEDSEEESPSDFPYSSLLWLLPVFVLIGWLVLTNGDPLGNNVPDNPTPPKHEIPAANIDSDKPGKYFSPEEADSLKQKEELEDLNKQLKNKGIEHMEINAKDKEVPDSYNNNTTKLPKDRIPETTPNSQKQKEGGKKAKKKKPMANLNNVNPPPKTPVDSTEQNLEIPQNDNSDIAIVHDQEPSTIEMDAAPMTSVLDDAPPMSSMSVADPLDGFLPIAALESLINSNFSNKSITIKMRKRMAANIAVSPDEKIDFRFSGSMASKENLSRKQFKVHLFNNSELAYQDFLPLKSFSLTLRQGKGGAYPFDIKEALSLSSGLYYYLVREVNSEEVYFVGKFKVGLREE